MPSINYLNCCGLKELTQLRTIIKPAGAPWSAKAAMIQFLTYFVYTTRTDYDNRIRPAPLIYGFYPPTYMPPGAHIIFSDAHEPIKDQDGQIIASYYIENPTGIRYGKAFAKFILKNGLGTVSCTRQQPNPNYFQNLHEGGLAANAKGRLNQQHMITCWIWTVDHKALYEFCVANVPTPYVDGKITVPQNGPAGWDEKLKQYWRGQIGWDQLMSHALKAPNKVVEPHPTPATVRAEMLQTTRVPPTAEEVQNNLNLSLARIAGIYVPPPVLEAARRPGRPGRGLRW